MIPENIFFKDVSLFKAMKWRVIKASSRKCKHIFFPELWCLRSVLALHLRLIIKCLKQQTRFDLSFCLGSSVSMALLSDIILYQSREMHWESKKGVRYLEGPLKDPKLQRNWGGGVLFVSSGRKKKQKHCWVIFNMFIFLSSEIPFCLLNDKMGKVIEKFWLNRYMSQDNHWGYNFFLNVKGDIIRLHTLWAFSYAL